MGVNADEKLEIRTANENNERIAFRNRPIDVLSFLSRDELTINDGAASTNQGEKEIELQVRVNVNWKTDSEENSTDLSGFESKDGNGTEKYGIAWT